MMTKLRAVGVRCVSIDLTSIGSQQVSAEQWYGAIAAHLVKGFALSINISQWWRNHTDLPVVARLAALIDTVLLVEVQQPVAILIDEIDIIAKLKFTTDDFFALIRNCYDCRSTQSRYSRLTFALFGVTTPRDLITDKTLTPFNIGCAISLEGFSLNEAAQLATGLEEWIPNPQDVLARIFYWTGGQPFLTQKLCQLVIEAARTEVFGVFRPSDVWVDKLVETRVIDRWEMQDQPEHLRTIRDRLLHDEMQAGQLLGQYQRILEQGAIKSDGSGEQTDLLLSGLVSRQQGQLVAKNRIYERIFNLVWVIQELNDLRPYGVMLQKWAASGMHDSTWLLRGSALKAAQVWQQGKSLSNLDYQFLQASQHLKQHEIQKQLKTERLQAENARLQQVRQLARLKTVLLGVVSVAFLGALGLSRISWQQYQHAKDSEVLALASSSQGLFSSNQQLDAMVEAVRAKRALQKLATADERTTSQVEAALNQAVFGSNEFNQLVTHGGRVLSVDIDPSGELIATASNDRTVKLWSRDGTLLHTLPHQDTVHRVVFSPDGAWVITACLDGGLYIWAVDGQLKKEVQAHDQPVWGVAASPDGSLIASASGDGTIKLWRPDGTLINTLSAAAAVWNVAFSPDSRQVAGAILNGTIQRWTLDGRSLPSLEGHQEEVWDVAYCPHVNRLVSVSSDRTLRIWSSNGELLRDLPAPEQSALLGVDCSDNGNTIATSGKGNSITIWRSDGTFIRTLRGHGAVVRDVALSPDGRIAASASDDGTVRLWQRNRYLLRSLIGHHDTVWGIAVSPDAETVASLGASDELILWQDFRPQASLETTQRSVVFEPSGKTLITSGVSSLNRFTVEQVFAQNRTPTLRVDTQLGLTFGMALWPSYDGTAKPVQSRIATGGDNGVIKLWTAEGTLKQTFSAHRSRIWQLAFSPDGQWLASASEDGTVKLWKGDGTLIDTPVNQTGAVWGVTFSPDGKTVAATSIDDTLHLWDVASKTLRQISGQSDGLTRVAFSPDGQTIATGGIDTTVKLWNRDGTLQNTLLGHKGIVTSLAYSPDGRYLYSGSDDSRILVWDIEKINDLDPLNYACDWIRDYLQTSETLSEDDRSLCLN